MIRCFIAIDLPGSLKKKIGEIQAKLKGSGADVKWVKPDNIHLTLKFLGEITPEKVEEVKASLDGISVKKMEISARNVGAFPSLKRPRVIWVGIEKGLEKLKDFSNIIEKEMQKIGFEKEKRSFKPHLTIGRVKSQRNIGNLVKEIGLIEEFETEPFIPEEFILMRSDLKPSGAEYTPIKKYRLI
ncbi:RNA 2',3'-cyclic phosphodiesterase [candidate division KSB1 bacterium]|nr:MAG: RNA 2',3'-cyclic phosphodiesterase [candidate division KSB1 bacterium]